MPVFYPAMTNKKPGALLQPGLNFEQKCLLLVRHQHGVYHVYYAIALKYIGNGNP
jgi:hypothetical protein